MARPNTRSLVFGLSAVELLQNNKTTGITDITGELSADVNPEIIRTVGGAASYTRYARLGRSEGAGTLMLNERPVWIEEIAGGTPADTAASSTATIGSVVDVEKGGNTNSLSGISVAAATGTGANVIDHAYSLQIEATGAAIVRVTFIASSGAEEVANITVGSTATEILNTGITLSESSPNYTAGDVVRVDVRPPHGGITTIGIPQVRVANEYEIQAYSNKGGAADVIEKLTFHRVLIVGSPFTRTDVAMPTTEIPIEIMAPEGGGDIITRELIQREA